MASSISDMQINSLAEWLRLLLPGPIFSDGNAMSAWSDNVGDPKGVRPKATMRCTNGS